MVMGLVTSLGVASPALASAPVDTAAPAVAPTVAPTVAKAGCYGQDCNGKDPQAWGCEGDATTRYSAHYPEIFGSTIELRYSVSCGAFWARYSCNDCVPNCGQPIISLQNGKARNGTVEVVQTLTRDSSASCRFWTGMLTAVNRFGRVRVGQIFSWPGGSTNSWKPWSAWYVGI